MFHCPNCNRQPLTRLKTDIGVLWMCEQCKGRAVAVSLLRQRVEKQFVNGLWQQARAEDPPQRLPEKGCPACIRPMVAVQAGAVSEMMELDVCKSCHMVWFDPSETEQLPLLPPPPKEPELSPEAREAIALAKVELIRKRAEAEQAREIRGPMPDDWWAAVVTLFGLPVEEGAPGVERHPWVTWILGLLIMGVAAAMFFSGNAEEMVRQFGLIPAEVGRMGGLTLLTSFFLHSGVLHLLGNVYFLLVFGDNTEDYLGPIRYLLLLIAATIAGALAHVAFNPASTIPCIGASGGISGIIAYYAFRFPHVRLVLGWRYFVYVRWFRLSVPWALVLWLLLQLFGAWQQWHGFSNVSAAAHLGGAAAGMIFFFITRLAEGGAERRPRV